MATEWTKEDYVAAAKLEGWRVTKTSSGKDTGFALRIVNNDKLCDYVDPSKHFVKETQEEAMIRCGWFRGDNKKVGDRAGVYERWTSFGEQARMDFPPGATFWADWWYKKTKHPELPKPRRKRKDVELEEGRLYWCELPLGKEQVRVVDERGWLRSMEDGSSYNPLLAGFKIYEIENGRKGRKIK